MHVTNIEWDIDLDDAFEDFNQNLIIEEQAEMLDMSIDDYKKLSIDEIEDIFFDNARRNRFDIANSLYNLPTNIDVPQEFINGTQDRQTLAEWMTEYISNEYGFCIEGYDFDDELEENIERE